MEKVNVPKLRFPKFEGDWKKKRLVEVAVITTGSTPSTKVEDYYNGNRLFVSPADLQGNRYVEKTKTTLTELGFSKGRKIQKGSVLFVCIGSTIGKVGVPVEDCLTNQQINSLNARNEFSNNFIYSLLELNANEIKLLAGVQAVPQINKTDFSKLSFYFPSLPEQTKIASFLTTVDDKLQALKKKKTLLEQYKKGVMQKIFSQELRFKDDDGKDYPDWEEKKLGEIFYSEKGKGISKNKIVSDGKYECVLYGELYTKYNEVISNIVSKTNELDGIKSMKGDLLIPSSTTTTGIDLANVTALNKNDVLLGGDITILRSNLRINNVFYAYYLSNHKKDEIASYAQGSTIVHLYYNHIKDMIIDLPFYEEQTKIANFLSAIDNKIQEVEAQITKMEVWKKGLLQQMFC